MKEEGKEGRNEGEDRRGVAYVCARKERGAMIINALNVERKRITR